MILLTYKNFYLRVELSELSNYKKREEEEKEEKDDDDDYEEEENLIDHIVRTFGINWNLKVNMVQLGEKQKINEANNFIRVELFSDLSDRAE